MFLKVPDSRKKLDSRKYMAYTVHENNFTKRQTATQPYLYRRAWWWEMHGILRISNLACSFGSGISVERKQTLQVKISSAQSTKNHEIKAQKKKVQVISLFVLFDEVDTQMIEVCGRQVPYCIKLFTLQKKLWLAMKTLASIFFAFTLP